MNINSSIHKSFIQNVNNNNKNLIIFSHKQYHKPFKFSFTHSYYFYLCSKHFLLFVQIPTLTWKVYFQAKCLQSILKKNIYTIFLYQKQISTNTLSSREVGFVNLFINLLKQIYVA